MLRQKRRFARSLEVELAIAGMNFVEKAKMSRDCFGQLRVSRGHKRDAPAGCPFLLEKIENLLTVC